VVEEHHPDRVRTSLRRKSLRAQPREVEPRHHVGDDDDRIAVDLADARLAVRGVGDGEHRVGMRMIDPAPGQDRMENRLDRGRRCADPSHLRRKLVDHFDVGQLGQRRQTSQRLEPDRGKTGGLDRCEIPTAALDVKNVLVVAKKVFHRELDRRVAAAVEDQRRVASQQA